MPNDNILIKNYEHINRSFPNWDTPQGKYIKSRKHYEEELSKGGFKPYDGSGRAEQKKWQPSDNLQRNINQLKSRADKKGNLKVDDGMVRQLKDMGVSFNPKFMTNDLKGGIDVS
jgi:hypothetical protein